MKEYNVYLNGLWFFDYIIEANTKEEAIKKAMNEMELESGSIDLTHIDQYVEEYDGVGVGPGINDMNISSEYFPEILKKVYAKEEKQSETVK